METGDKEEREKRGCRTSREENRMVDCKDGLLEVAGVPRPGGGEGGNEGVVGSSRARSACGRRLGLPGAV